MLGEIESMGWTVLEGAHVWEDDQSDTGRKMVDLVGSQSQVSLCLQVVQAEPPELPKT